MLRSFLAKNKRLSSIYTGKQHLGARAFSVEINVERNPAFKVIDDSDLSHFESILPKNAVVTDEAEIEPWNTDWTKKFVGQSKLMLKPSTNEQVSNIL